MAKYRNNLPQIGTDRIFLSEGGIMTTFFFSEETKDIEVPKNNIFFPLLKDTVFTNWMDKFYREHMDLCLKENKEFGYILLAFFTYKARKEDIRKQFGIDEQEWTKMYNDYIQHYVDLRTEYETCIPNCPPIVIQGLIVPKGGRGDAFSLDTKMTIKEAEEYHASQIKVFAEETKVDCVLVVLVTYSEEAIGILNVAAKFNLPIIISYTTEVDGHLQGGETVKESIKTVDDATGKDRPAYYMINCSHTTHFGSVFEDDEGNEHIKRIGGLKPNASRKSHKELNNSDTLDDGNPEEFGKLLVELYQKAGKQPNCLSGCCGTDIRHLKETIKYLGKQ